MAESVAIVGMGQMGSGLGERLRESGYDVRGYDINEATRARLKAAGFGMAPSIGEAISSSRIILSSLPDSRSVREAWLGTDGIVAKALLKKQSDGINHHTTPYHHARTHARRALPLLSPLRCRCVY